MNQKIIDLVNEQSEDVGLCFDAQTASEAYLQRALRELHDAIEKAIPEININCDDCGIHK